MFKFFPGDLRTKACKFIQSRKELEVLKAFEICLSVMFSCCDQNLISGRKTKN